MNQTRLSISEKDVLAVALPVETSTYKPVEHKRLIDLTMEHADKEGFILKERDYKGAAGGNIVTAYYDFLFGDSPDLGLRIAWQNSYNKQVTLKFAIGANVFVCGNGAFYGDMGAFKHKHTGNIQTFTPEKVIEYFKTAGDVYQKIATHKDRMKEIETTKKVTAQIIGDLYLNEGVIKETQIAIIKKEIENPSFNYNADGSAWQLYNHITHSLKTTHPVEYLDVHTKTHQYFVNTFNLDNPVYI